VEFKLSQNPEFKILEGQNPKFKILEGQNPEFKILEAVSVKGRFWTADCGLQTRGKMQTTDQVGR